jgi:hypothetical protein
MAITRGKNPVISAPTPSFATTLRITPNTPVAPGSPPPTLAVAPDPANRNVCSRVFAISMGLVATVATAAAAVAAL